MRLVVDTNIFVSAALKASSWPGAVVRLLDESGGLLKSAATETLTRIEVGGAAMRAGGCLCGAIRYTVANEPITTGICHCQTCRRVASAPTLPFAGFSISDFVVTQGEPVEFRSSPHVIRTFCGRCGSPLTYRNEHEPEAIDIMMCSLDDPNALPPTFSVWVSEKLVWDRAADDLPAYEKSRASSDN